MTVANDNRSAAAAKAAQLRADEARKERQRKQVIAAVVAVVVVIAAVVIGVVVAGGKKTPAAGPTGGSSGGAGDFVSTITSIPAAAFEAAGAPAAGTTATPAKVQGGAALEEGGKPKVVYVGAEFCPYCATERWSLVAALSRFGTFTGLEPTRSAENDGNIPTVTFTKAKYTSDFVVFQPVETRDREGQPLQEMPADISALFTKHNPQGGIPWTYYGTAATSGSGVPIDAFTSLTGDDAWTKIAGEMATGTGSYGKPIDANANVITAQVCQLTKGQPSTVCTSPAVMAATALLPK